MSDFAYGFLVALVFVAIEVGLVGPAVFLLAWRRRLNRSWTALLPLAMFWVLGECGGRRTRDKVVLVVVCGLGIPTAQGVLAALPLTSSGSQSASNSEPSWGALAVGLAALAMLLAGVIVWLASWDAVCQVTGQSSKKVWLFFVPLVNFAMPWVIAFQAKPGERAMGEFVIGTTEVTPFPVLPRIPATAGPPTDAPPPAEKLTKPRTRVLRRPPAWLLSNLVLVALFGAFLIVGGLGLVSGDGEGDAAPTIVPATPTQEPDRVVAILLTCDFADFRAATIFKDDCARAVGLRQAVNYRKEITVRTYSGSTYTVTVLPDTYGSLRVGDTFP